MNIVGLACSDFGFDQDTMLDELVFDVSYRALRDAGLRKQDVGLSVQCSADVYDARSYSGGLAAPAAAGYLSQIGRVEGDAMVGLLAAIAAVLSRQVETALVVAYFRPEIAAADAAGIAGFTELISNYAFDPHLGRPVGLTASAVLALHASAALADGRVDPDDLAVLAAEEITAGAARPRTVRPSPMTARQVLDAPATAWPLTDPMLPALTSGAVAFVLSGRARAPRCRQIHGRITGWGTATNPPAAALAWLHNPEAATRTAAAKAYLRAGVSSVGDEVDHIELTALSPALRGPMLHALGVPEGYNPARVNRSGGVRSCFPGLANGALRVVEALDALRERGGRGRAVAHSMDNMTGLICADTSVLVLETP